MKLAVIALAHHLSNNEDNVWNRIFIFRDSILKTDEIEQIFHNAKKALAH